MATAVRQSNIDGIAQCGMSRATPEATGCHSQATTCSVLPQWPPGQQQVKQRQKNGQTLLAISMAAAVPRYDTAHIAWWLRSRALVEATGRCHWASIVANSCNRSCICHFFWVFSSSACRKRSWVNAKTPIYNRDMTYQMNKKDLEKDLTKVTEYFVGVVKMPCYCLNEHNILPFI